MPLNVVQGLFFFISLNLWFSFAEDGGICVFTNMTAASNCERPSSTLKFPGCLTSEQLCLFAVPESWIAWLHYSSLRIIVYDTKPHPRYVPRKQCASPSPVHPSTAHEWWVHSRRPPVPLGWQKIMSASRWETLRRSWCEQCLTLLPPRQMEPSKKKGWSEAEDYLLALLFSPHTWQHVCTSTSWTSATNHPPVWQVGLDDVSCLWSYIHLGGFSFLCHTLINTQAHWET